MSFLKSLPGFQKFFKNLLCQTSQSPLIPALAAITLEPRYGNMSSEVVGGCTSTLRGGGGGCNTEKGQETRGGRDVQGMLTARQRRFAGVRSRPAAAARFRPGRLFVAGVTGGADLQRARPGATSGANVASASFTGESARRGDGGVDGAVGAASRAGASLASSAGR